MLTTALGGASHWAQKLLPAYARLIIYGIGSALVLAATLVRARYVHRASRLEPTLTRIYGQAIEDEVLVALDSQSTSRSYNIYYCIFETLQLLPFEDLSSLLVALIWLAEMRSERPAVVIMIVLY